MTFASVQWGIIRFVEQLFWKPALQYAELLLATEIYSWVHLFPFYVGELQIPKQSSVSSKDFKISYQIWSVYALLRALERNSFAPNNLFQLLNTEFLLCAEMCYGFFKMSRSVCKEVMMVRFFFIPFSWGIAIKKKQAPRERRMRPLSQNCILLCATLCCAACWRKKWYFVNSQTGTRMWMVNMDVY